LWNKKGDLIVRFLKNSNFLMFFFKNVQELLVVQLNTFPVKVHKKFSLEENICDIDPDPYSSKMLVLSSENIILKQFDYFEENIFLFEAQ